VSTEDIARPLPDITPRMRPFYEAATERRLVIQECLACGTTRFPAVDTCSECLASNMRWVTAAGTGDVFSFVIMHQIYHPWFAERAPYVVAQIKLTEGPRVTSTIIDMDPHLVRIGMKVEVDFQTCNEQITLPVFRATAETSRST
jgi:uncharacterized OB-fold protein